jgi:hypothetical protein
MYDYLIKKKKARLIGYFPHDPSAAGAIRKRMSCGPPTPATAQVKNAWTYRHPRPHTPSWRILTPNKKFFLSKYRIDTNVADKTSGH